MFDPVRAFIASKDAYARTRGARSGTGIYPETKTIPKTTYGDAITFSTLFLDSVSIKGCLRRLATTYAAEARRRGKCGTIPVLGYDACKAEDWLRYWGSGSKTGCYFQETTSYKRARSEWIDTWPWKKDPANWAMKFNQEYPWNEEFWVAGLKFAIARSAAGEVPGKFDIAMESVREAIDELPATVAEVVKKANPLNYVPQLGLGTWGELIKWGSIGGGLFLLYQYVLRPKK